MKAKQDRKLGVGLATKSVIGCCLILIGCSNSPVQAPVDLKTCKATNITLSLTSDPGAEIRQRLHVAEGAANKILASPEFAAQCVASTMSRTNGRSVPEVCHQMQCAGPVALSVDFYSDAGTRAIAYEARGKLFLNTAKESAGSPGNLAHEFAHTLGFTHFTNWAWLASGSVPYVVGDLVDSLAQGDHGGAAP